MSNLQAVQNFLEDLAAVVCKLLRSSPDPAFAVFKDCVIVVAKLRREVQVSDLFEFKDTVGLTLTSSLSTTTKRITLFSAASLKASRSISSEPNFFHSAPLTAPSK
jgi:hypothetical protein